MAGLPSFGFQVDRLIACLTFGFDEQSALCVGLSESKGLGVAMELLNARAEIHRVLYFHKTILGMEWLLGGLLDRLRDLASGGVTIRSAGVVPSSVLEMIQGKPVAVDGILDLDDYAIWMLIRKIAEVTGGDPTAAELARRLLERDPLRAVRLDSKYVEEFFATDPRGRHDRVAAVVAKYVEGDPNYFFRAYPISFGLWEEDKKASALLVTDGPDYEACSLSEHPIMHERFPRPTEKLGHRLFVPRESREEVEKLVRGR